MYKNELVQYIEPMLTSVCLHQSEILLDLSGF